MGGSQGRGLLDSMEALMYKEQSGSCKSWYGWKMRGLEKVTPESEAKELIFYVQGIKESL